MTQDTCETCRFWRPDGDRVGDRDGECRRRAPIAKTFASNEEAGQPLYANFPMTWCESWCGEHEGVPSVSREMIEAAKTPAGGWTRATLAAWGVPWPPPKGWRKRLEEAAAEAIDEPEAITQ